MENHGEVGQSVGRAQRWIVIQNFQLVCQLHPSPVASQRGDVRSRNAWWSAAWKTRCLQRGWKLLTHHSTPQKIRLNYGRLQTKKTHQNLDAMCLTFGEIGTHPKLDIHAGFHASHRRFRSSSFATLKSSRKTSWRFGHPSFASHPMPVHPQEPRDLQGFSDQWLPQGEHVTFNFHCSQFGV